MSDLLLVQRAVDRIRHRNMVKNPSTGLYERTSLFEKQLTQLVEFSIPGGEEATFETVSLASYKATLSGEYGIRIENGDLFPVPMPAKYNPVIWDQMIWVVPTFDYDDGIDHVLFEVYKDSNNWYKVTKLANNLLELRTKASGTEKSVTLAAVFYTNEPIFVRVDFIANAKLNFARAADTTLTDVTISSVGTFAGTGTDYIQYVGSDHLGDDTWAGIHNVLVSDYVGDEAVDRFNGGSPMTLQGFGKWLDLYASRLVFGAPCTFSTATAQKLNAVWTPAYLSSIKLWADANKQAEDDGLVKSESFYDTFTRADGAAGSLESGQTWNVPVGSWTVVGGVLSTPGGALAEAYFDCGFRDVVVCMNFVQTTNGRSYGMVFRRLDATNKLYLKLTSNSTTVELRKVDGGVDSLLASATGSVSSSDSITSLQVRMIGDNIYVVTNSVPVDFGGTGGAYVLSGGDDTKFGSGLSVTAVTGIGPARLATSSGTTTVDEVRVDRTTHFISTLYDYSGNGYDLTQANEWQKMWMHWDGTRWSFRGGRGQTIAYTATLISSAAAGYIAVGVARLGELSNGEDHAWLGSADEAGAARYFYVGVSRSGSVTKLEITQRNSDTTDIVRGSTSLTKGQALLAEFTSDGAAYGVTADGAAETLSVDGGADTGDWFGDTTARDNSSVGGLRRSTEGQFSNDPLTAIVLADAVPSPTDRGLVQKHINLNGKLGKEGVLTNYDLWGLQTITLTPVKGSATPALNGVGGAVGTAIASITTPVAVSMPDIFSADLSIQGQRIIKLDTGVSGTKTRRYRFGYGGGLNGMTAGQYYSMSLLAGITGGSLITPAHVKIRCVDSVGSTDGDTLSQAGAWEFLSVQRQINAAATYAYFELQVEDGLAFATANDYVVFAMPTVVAGQCVPAPILNDAEGTVSKAADSAYMPFDVEPQAMTIYTRFFERGSLNLVSRIWTIGNASDAYLGVLCGGGTYDLYHNNGVSSVSKSTPGGVALNDLVELRACVYADGSVQIGQSVNGGAEVVSTVSAALGFDTAWGDAKCWIGCVDNIVHGMMALTHHRVEQGTRDLATMRVLAGVE